MIDTFRFQCFKGQGAGESSHKGIPKRKSWKRLLVRPVVITIDHMEKVKGRSLTPVSPFQGFEIQRNEALDLGIPIS
jgi:hypothetical protein